MAATKARLLVQRYALGSSHCAGKHKKLVCPLCHGSPDDPEHFLLNCPVTHNTRKPYMHKVNKIFAEFYFEPRHPDDTIKAILDCSTLTWLPEAASEELERITRRMIFQLHNTRAVLLGLGSRFSNVRNNAWPR
jgi:hypothetical protein